MLNLLKIFRSSSSRKHIAIFASYIFAAVLMFIFEFSGVAAFAYLCGIVIQSIQQGASINILSFSYLIDYGSVELSLNLFYYFLFYVLASPLVKFIPIYFGNNLSVGIKLNISKSLHEKFLNYTPATVRGRKINELQSMLIAQLDILHDNVFRNVFLGLSALMFIFSSLVALFIIFSLSYVMFPSIFIIVYFVVYVVVRDALKRNSEKIRLNDIERTKFLSRSLFSLAEIQIYRISEIFIKNFDTSQKAYANGHKANYNLETTFHNVAESIFLMFGLFVIGFGLFSQVGNIVETGSAISSLVFGALLAALRLKPHIIMLMTAVASLRSNAGIIDNFAAILSEEGLRSRDWGSEKTRVDATKSMRVDLASLRVEGVDVRYQENGPTILRSVSLELKRGQIIGLLGKSGSGKSTLAHTICGLISPLKGRVVTIDNTGEAHSVMLPDDVGYIPQYPVTFGENLLESIVLDERSNINSLALKEAIDAASLLADDADESDYNRLLRLPCDELSGGQLQRVAIARALYRRPKFLIMDEPTSALDVENQRRIVQNLKMQKKIGILIISHQLRILKACDYWYFVGSNKCSSMKKADMLRWFEAEVVSSNEN